MTLAKTNSCKGFIVSLCKQQALDADPKSIQQIKFTGNLDWDGNTQMFFIIEEANQSILGFSKGIAKVL